MIRTIVTADKNRFVLILPDEFLGKQVEVIAFVIGEAAQRSDKKASFTILPVPEELKKNYRFNRDEAHER